MVDDYAAKEATVKNEYLDKYRWCMEEIKMRSEVIDALTTGRCNAVYLQTTAESAILQLRKVLELIALASLVANKQKYEESRSCFAKDWNARRIISHIKSFNPDFYPLPTRQVIDPETGRVIATKNIKSGFLTESEMENAYDKCSWFLHSQNPFSRPHDVKEFFADLPRLMGRIRVLLNHHQVQLVDEDLQLWVIMNTESEGGVQVSLFKRIDVTDVDMDAHPGKRREEVARIIAGRLRTQKESR